MQQHRRVEAANRRVDELDRVERRQRAAGSTQRSRHLHEAAWVAARVGVRLGFQDTCGFPIAEVGSGLGLDDVVDPGAAAADLLLRRLDELESRDRAQELTRLGADSLCVREMTGVLERDAERQRVDQAVLARLLRMNADRTPVR